MLQFHNPPVGLPPFPRPERGAPWAALTRSLPAGFRLRPARSGDLAFLRRLYRGTREDELAATGWPAAAKAAFCDSQFALQHADWVARLPRAWFLVALHGSQPVGRLVVDPPGAAFHVVDVALLPERRGHGLGTALLGGVQSLAAAAGVPATLQVLSDNRRARALYGRLGFRPDGAAPAPARSVRQALRWTPPAAAPVASPVNR